MQQYSTLAWFLFRFVLLYGILIWPWPGLNSAYGSYFASLGNFFLSHQDAREMVRLEGIQDQHGFTSLNARIILVNPNLRTGDGNAAARTAEFDTRSIGWVPTSLTVALILSSAISWMRRITALLGGLLLIHAFILLSIQTWIWNESIDLSLIDQGAVGKVVLDALEYTMVTQIGVSFFVPILVWLLVTFRRTDAKEWLFKMATNR